MKQEKNLTVREDEEKAFKGALRSINPRIGQTNISVNTVNLTENVAKAQFLPSRANSCLIPSQILCFHEY